MSGAIYAEGMAKGRVEDKADSVTLYMRKTGATFDEALDFFEVHEPQRSAVIALIEERTAAPVV